MVNKLRLLGLSVALSLLILPGFAVAHIDSEGDLEMTCSRTFGDLTDPEETQVAWWWCYGNNEFEELIVERDPKFSLSMKVVVLEEETGGLLAKCSGELSTKDFGFVEELPCDSESTCGVENGEGHDCHIEEGDFEEAGLDINDVIPGLGECEIAQEEFETDVIFKGDVKALHNAAGGDDNGRRDKGNRGSHDKDIEVCGGFA